MSEYKIKYTGVSEKEHAGITAEETGLKESTGITAEEIGLKESANDQELIETKIAEFHDKVIQRVAKLNKELEQEEYKKKKKRI